jgi:hypothetical protein
LVNLVGPDVSIKTYSEKLNPLLNEYLYHWRGGFNIFICDFITEDLINRAIHLNSGTSGGGWVNEDGIPAPVVVMPL